jgi:hypothetical protein
MAAIVFPLFRQTMVGVACGCLDFLFTAAAQKTCMVAGIKFQEEKDEDDVPACERFDKKFLEYVVIFPIVEECVLRGILQPLLKQSMLSCIPRLAIPILAGVSIAGMVSVVAIGILFGATHYFNYSSGGMPIACIVSVSGIFYGVLKERFSLVTTIGAHIVHNFGILWMDKYYPAFFE